MGTDTGKETRIRITSTKSGRFTCEGEVTISGLTEHEVEKVEGFVCGNSWMRVARDKRIEFRPTLQPLPDPIEDVEMLPFWRKAHPGEVAIQEEIFDKTSEYFSPSFIIQHLCGYHYTPERYRTEADKLKSWGFECLRSRRGANGKFWELWLLPGLFLAEGALKKATEKEEDHKKQAKKAVDFLCTNASFGTLDVCVQRAAMSLE